jgi:large subunit ribosomal protein L25
MDNKKTMVNAQPRVETGTSFARRLRGTGWVPAVINDVEGKARPIQINRHEFELLLRHHTGESLLLDVQIGDEKPRKTLLKEVQHDPISGAVLHADFKEILMTKKLRISIPVELVGNAIGVEAGGILEHLIREIEVECLPADIIESINVDVSALNIGNSLTVGDLTIDPKLTVLTSPTVAVASVSAPRLEEEKVEEEVAEVAQPEVIGEKEREEAEKEKEGKEGKEEKGKKEKKEKE